MNLQINSLSKEYSGHEVLNEISFSIGDGEFVGLIGENGSGKTTLLKIIASLEKSDSGSIQIVPKETTIGYIPQAPDQVGNLSSGELARKYLAEVMAKHTDLLLLDEPTNHLDFEALLWLENYLKNYKGTVIAISHDRRFLDNLATKILELDKGKIKVYGGNYSFFRQQKEIERQAYERQYFIQQKKIARTKQVINDISNRAQSIEGETIDFYWLKRAAKVARKAVTQRRKLERFLESEKKLEKPEVDFELSAIFRPKTESSKTVVFLKNISKRFDQKEILKDFNLLINRGEKIALTGANGSGKTTLLNIILGKLEPDTGTVEIGDNVEIGYLPQEHQEENSDEGLLENIISATKIDKTSAYKLAKRFLFTEGDLRTAVKNLSSGQKSKLALAKIMTSGANFIILDEPTNHLDIPSREALETAIASYPGTLLFVTHDRYLLDMINPDRIIELT